jgi:hypothetical protein
MSRPEWTWSTWYHTERDREQAYGHATANRQNYITMVRKVER